MDAEYRFLWIDCGSSVSCTDPQIFNRRDLREKLVDGNFGLPAPVPDLHYFLFGDDAFTLMPWMVKPYSRMQLTREERITNYRISRDRMVVRNTFGILVNWFRVLLGTMEQMSKIFRDIVFTCVVLQNMLRTHQGTADKAPTPGNDVATHQNEQAVYVPNQNSREAKHQRELLKDYFNHVAGD